MKKLALILLFPLLSYGAQQTINLGSAPSGAGGDNNRQAFTKVNANFDELYPILSGALTKTITLGGNFTHTGAHTLTLTTSANTSVTLPTTGTLTTTTVTDALDVRLDDIEADVWEIADPGADSFVVWNDTSNEVETVPQAPYKTHSETFTILEPDAVQGVSDDVILKKFVAEKYPNGVTIVAIHIDASAAYTSETFLFEHWDNASGTTQATVESITSSAISTEDDGTLSDATIPADHFLVLNLDGTPEDKAYVSITIVYIID